ncbi:MAG: DNA-directed RNA polymerase subunit D [archaeon]
MKIENMKEKGKKLEFKLKDSTPATANAIRRTLQREIPTLAVTKVSFFENTSAMFDEYIAHRIGMTPLSTPEDYELTESAPSTMMSLTAKEPGIVHAEEMEIEDPKVEVVNPKIPIIKLRENQEIDLEGKIELGLGKEHARHKPCLATYKTQVDKKAKDDPETEFQFTVESYVKKKPKELLKQSLEIIKDKTNEFQEKIESGDA